MKVKSFKSKVYCNTAFIRNFPDKVHLVSGGTLMHELRKCAANDYILLQYPITRYRTELGRVAIGGDSLFCRVYPPDRNGQVIVL